MRGQARWQGGIGGRGGRAMRTGDVKGRGEGAKWTGLGDRGEERSSTGCALVQRLAQSRMSSERCFGHVYYITYIHPRQTRTTSADSTARLHLPSHTYHSSLNPVSPTSPLRSPNYSSFHTASPHSRSQLTPAKHPQSRSDRLDVPETSDDAWPREKPMSKDE